MAGPETCVRKPGLERALLDKDARADGETEQPVKSVTAWRAAAVSHRSRAAARAVHQTELENLTIRYLAVPGTYEVKKKVRNLSLPGKDVTISVHTGLEAECRRAAS